MGKVDEIDLWTAARVEYVYHFFSTRTGKRGTRVCPGRPLTHEEFKRVLKNSPWLAKRENRPEVRLSIDGSTRTIIITELSLVGSFLSEGETEFLRKHNETEFAKLLASKKLLTEQLGADAREVVKEAVSARLKNIAARESAFAEWFVRNDLRVPPEEKCVHAEIREDSSAGDQNKDRIIEVAHSKIRQLRKKDRFKNIPERLELLALVDKCRMKNEKINFSKLAREIGRSNKTAKKWCEHRGIS
jgi:hypothetical protein